jgi:hypothetical protein
MGARIATTKTEIYLNNCHSIAKMAIPKDTNNTQNKNGFIFSLMLPKKIMAFIPPQSRQKKTNSIKK